MSELPRAAYIPFRAESGFDPAVELAIAYLNHVGDAGSIVVVPLTNTIRYSHLLERYAKRRTVLTPRNSSRSRVGYGHPALVYAPGLKELELASQYTRDCPIVVVEDPSFSCARWADEIGAVNLIEKRIHSTHRSSEHQQILEAIDWAGNNGWFDAPGKRDLLRALDDLVALGKFDKEEILAYQIVRGRHGHSDSLIHLSKEIDKFRSTAGL